jgi:hypothetical protein
MSYLHSLIVLAGILQDDVTREGKATHSPELLAAAETLRIVSQYLAEASKTEGVES